MMLNIYEYQDYRNYLKDFYEEQKKLKPSFSYRYFSTLAGINSSAFLYYIITGKRNLTKNSILKVSTAIKHSSEESEYFENLVFFNQAKTITEKANYYSKIVDSRKPIDIADVTPERFEFYSKWYHSAIRELVTLYKFDTYHSLGKMLTPSITAKEAERSIFLLERLGFIESNNDGLYRQTENLIMSAPKGPDSFVIESFQTEMLILARESYNITGRKERLCASTTFSISQQTFELFKQKTREFRRELLEIARLDDNPEQVFQYTFNLFPLSRKADHNE